MDVRRTLLLQCTSRPVCPVSCAGANSLMGTGVPECHLTQTVGSPPCPEASRPLVALIDAQQKRIWFIAVRDSRNGVQRERYLGAN